MDVYEVRFEIKSKLLLIALKKSNLILNWTQQFYFMVHIVREKNSFNY